MSSNGKTTFQPGNNFGKGRHEGSRNKQQIALQQIGLDRAESLLQAHIKSAEEGNDSAREFLIGMFIPRCKPGRFVEFEIQEINTIDDILPAQKSIMNHVATGKLTLDEGDKLFEFIEHHRKTIEVTDLVGMIQGIDNRMKDAGI